MLDGDIPSALNPPSGCPFQTRCPRKSQVPNNLCEREVPPMVDVGNRHFIKCHLDDAVYSEMEPVIVLGGKNKKTGGKSKKSGAPTAATATALSVAALAEGPKKPARKAAPKKAAPTRAKAKPAPAKPVKKDASPPRMKKPAKPDDLKRISGVGPKLEGVLNGLGIYKFEQISIWKKAEREWVDGYLKFKGRIDRDNWVAQAKKLAKEK